MTRRMFQTSVSEGEPGRLPNAPVCRSTRLGLGCSISEYRSGARYAHMCGQKSSPGSRLITKGSTEPLTPLRDAAQPREAAPHNRLKNNADKPCKKARVFPISMAKPRKGRQIYGYVST